MQDFGKKWHIRQARIEYIVPDMAFEQTPLIGTWKLDVSRSRRGLPPFSALHTYSAGGTMISASSVLGKNTESPGHGDWSGDEDAGFSGVIEVFSFDEGGELAGVVRMRWTIRQDDPDRISGEMVVDLFPSGGEPQFDVDAASFEGKRIKAF